jgi:hypothetical protein
MKIKTIEIAGFRSFFIGKYLKNFNKSYLPVAQNSMTVKVAAIRLPHSKESIWQPPGRHELFVTLRIKHIKPKLFKPNPAIFQTFDLEKQICENLQLQKLCFTISQLFPNSI